MTSLFSSSVTAVRHTAKHRDDEPRCHLDAPYSATHRQERSAWMATECGHRS